ncbi:MAG: permease-like cell division protein FtsX [Clostridia bacterium]|nr:permease-like cell division protein FtsX [Clostridia bacterium]
MKIRGVRYFFSEAFKNIFSNGWMTLASIFTVMASLLVLGVFMVLSINLTSMAGDLEGNYQIVAIVDEAINDDGLLTIGKQLKDTPNVDSVILNTNEERLATLKERMGENGELLDRYQDDNPLRNMYLITLTDLSKSQETVDIMEDIAGIIKIQQNEESIDKLVAIANYIRNFSLWIIIALAVVSVFIISNTIKLTVYTRRKEINIMKFVGATDWFIRWPFIIEGIAIGIIGAGASIAIIMAGYSAIVNVVNSLNIMFFTVKPLTELTGIIIGSSLGLGAILGGLGSLISVRKHLNV